MADEKLVDAIRAEQGKIVGQLVANNPQWQRLQGMLDMAEGKVGLNEPEAQEAGAKEEVPDDK